MDNTQAAREKMVRDQIQRRGVVDPRILDAMNVVPRHLFVPAEYQNLAYQDRPLSIGLGQTISQPYIVALMTAQLRLTPEDIVLEIGTGSGYQAGILSRLVKQVYTIERFQPLAQMAKRVLKDLGYENVTVICQDGTLGLKEHAPFDAILIGAASPKIPEPLLDQLNIGGRIIVPIGGSGHQILQCVTKRLDGKLETDELFPVIFVPLRGYYGWHEDDWGN
ncbi:MAG: protein-L-isoaspartate(D-aspartate) O-methyltransferase [Anaerolineaceae bacterium]